MIETLERVTNPEARRALLAAAALASEPKPNREARAHDLGKLAVEAEDLLGELRSVLRIGNDDADAKLRIDEFLSSALATELSRDVDLEKTLERASAGGRLLPDFYEPKLTKAFLDTFSALSIQRSHVIDAIRKPDDYQHLAREEDVERDRASLFVKRVISNDPSRSHWLLVQSHRVKLAQVVQSAWRVFPSDTDLQDVSNPFGLLRAFAMSFGETVEARNVKSKFIEELDFPMNEELKVQWPSGLKYFVTANRTDNRALNVSRINFAFCINIELYIQSLHAHGFRTDERQFNRSGLSKLIWRSI